MEIEFNNQTYILDTEKAIELGVFKPKIRHCIGNKYIVDGWDGTYLLASGGPYMLTLVNLDNGKRLSEPVKVGDCYNVLEVDFQTLTGHRKYTLTKAGSNH